MEDGTPGMGRRERWVRSGATASGVRKACGVACKIYSAPWEEASEARSGEGAPHCRRPHNRCATVLASLADTLICDLVHPAV